MVNKLYRCSDAKKVETTTAETTTKTTEATTIETTTEEGDEQPTDETETTTESSPPSTTTSPTSEETAVTVDELEEETTTEGTNEETEEEYISTKTKSNEKQKIRTGARERQGPRSKEIELLPGGIARKFITLSIWSTRGRTDGDRKSFGRKNKGMTKIEEKISNECVDLNAHCEMWEKLGHCMHSTKYMNHYCRKSCGFCDREERSEIDSPKPKCTDKNHFCSYWARNGECDDGSKFMKLFCERSCGFC
uniref:ShKT domain-containing protein n=1 Tax=Meloidogyne enterolobii TaxID=390850 RepID=A0A6V7XBR2_MELEN|nr:unnamed protein product [Meloidogyne enterolobii]